VKTSHRISVVTSAAVVLATLVLALPVRAQLPKDPEERAKLIAQIYAANARQLTVFDKDGKAVATVGPRDLYN